MAPPFEDARTFMRIAASSSSSDRDSIAHGLSRMLADTHALYAKTWRFCRDVAGPESISLRPLLERQCDELRVATDVIASRMRALGLPVLRPPCSLLPAGAHRGPAWTAQEMIGCLTETHDVLARRAQGVLRLAKKHRDQGTCDLLMRRMLAHENAGCVLAALGIFELVRHELVAH